MSKKSDYSHQLEIVELSKKSDSLALLWDMGTGKTKGLIDVLRNRYNTERRLLPTLIFAPLVTIYNWKNEFKLWSKVDQNRIFVIDTNGKKRLQLLNHAIQETSDVIIIINYEAIQSDDIFDFFMAWSPRIIVADEMHLLKNHKSKRAKKVVKLGDQADYRYGLTGTPILNSVEDIFHQYRFLDKGKAFGKNFWVFRNTFMYDENAAWASRPGHFPKYAPRPEMFDVLNQKMYSIATRITKEDCLHDLPPLVRIKRDIQLGAEQNKAYKQMKKEFIAFVKDEKKSGKAHAVVAQLAITKALRLQQIISGFVVTDEGEEVEFKDNPRLDDTKDLLERLTPAHKVIVWCSFIYNYRQIERICKELKIPHVFITGEMNIKQKGEAMEAFRNDDSVRVVIANRKAAGIGINLVEASYSIVYSRNFSLGDEKQSEARNYRGGSQIHEKVTKIDMCAKDTIDEMILQALDNKQQLSDRIVDWVEEK